VTDGTRATHERPYYRARYYDAAPRQLSTKTLVKFRSIIIES